MRRRQTRARDHDVTYRDRASVDVRVELLTRIHKWRERVFYRPGRDVVYRHIDQLFGEPGQNVIDWQLIRTHWQDLMRIVVSIREGRLSSTLLLRRLSSESRRNNVYKALRELGRASCTITLLRLISEPELRAQIDAATKQGRVLQQLLRLARVYRRAARAQRPRRAGEDPPSAPGSMTTSPPTLSGTHSLPRSYTAGPTS